MDTFRVWEFATSALDIRADAELGHAQTQSEAAPIIRWTHFENGDLGDAVEECASFGGRSGAEAGSAGVVSFFKQLTLHILEHWSRIVALSLLLHLVDSVQLHNLFVGRTELPGQLVMSIFNTLDGYILVRVFF